MIYDLREFLVVHPKGRHDLRDSSVAVYWLPCMGCDQAYIGKTANIPLLTVNTMNYP